MTESHIKLTSSTHLDQARSKTIIGQAHFAGTGPKNTTCRGCEKWVNNGYYAKSGGGKLKPGQCLKYTELMNQVKKSVPHNAVSCRYYEKSEDKLPPLTNLNNPSLEG